MESQNPFTRSELLDALGSVEERVESFFAGLSDEEFVDRVGEAWNPAEHLSHLNTSVSAVARGFSLPRIFVRMRFGRAKNPSRSLAELRQLYLEGLAAGGRASGGFVPTPVSGSARDERARLLARWGRVNARLREAFGPWSERDLDRLRLPHPLLGLLTAREMLLFTILHNQHHIEAAKRRLTRFAGQP
jgi:hypothetical protein